MTKYNHLGIPVRSSIYPDWWKRCNGKLTPEMAVKIRENIHRLNYPKAGNDD